MAIGNAAGFGSMRMLGFASALHVVTHVAQIVINALKNAAKTISGWVNESMDYVETLNLFTVTMGQFSEEAMKYAEQVESVMGINIADWMNA